MLEFLKNWIALFEGNAGKALLGASVLMLAECFLPQSRNSLASRVRGGTFWVVYIAATAAAIIIFHKLWNWVGIKPLFQIDLSALSKSGFPVLAAVGGVLASLLVLQINDFFYYWFHRLQHSNKFLWRFHAEHHALEEVNAFNSAHHFTEEFFRIPFMAIPLSLLFSFKQGYVPWIWSLVIGWHAIFIHSSTRLNLGWLRYALIDNRFHRIHHSKEHKHFDKNFGGTSAIWDILFGTAHYPKRDEWPDVGLDDMKQAANTRQFLFRAFRKRDGSLEDQRELPKGYEYSNQSAPNHHAACSDH